MKNTIALTETSGPTGEMVYNTALANSIVRMILDGNVTEAVVGGEIAEVCVRQFVESLSDLCMMSPDDLAIKLDPALAERLNDPAQLAKLRGLRIFVVEDAVCSLPKSIAEMIGLVSKSAVMEALRARDNVTVTTMASLLPSASDLEKSIAGA